MDATTRGVLFMIATMVVFSSQDAISKLLAESYPSPVIVMIRYWAFAAFVIALSAARPGGLTAQIRTRHPAKQILRGLLLVLQICIVTFSFAQIGLAETHAILSSYSLIIAALSPFILGEKADRWISVAVGVGFLGLLVLLRPGSGVFDVYALAPVAAAVMFATYGLLTRLVSRDDPSGVSFFYTGVAGAVGVSVIGPFFWTPMAQEDWGWMALLCFTGALGHYLMIKAYECAEAATLQPFAYLQLVFTTAIGVLAFSERLDMGIIVGGAIVVAAGLGALFRQRVIRRLGG